MKELFKKMERSSIGRRQMNHQQGFDETMAQYELCHLNDLTYDRII